MFIKSIYIKNFKGIEDQLPTIPLNDGESIILLGPNGSGKTSFIDAVYSVLDPSYIPAKPINMNSDKAKVELEFQDGDKIIKASLSITEKTKVLTLKHGDFNASSPRKVLNKMIGGNINFNPIEFAQMSSSAKGKRFQAETILKILGLDLSKIETTIKDFEAQRLASHRDLKSLKSERDVAYKNLPTDKEKFLKEVSLSKLLEEKKILDEGSQAHRQAEIELKSVVTMQAEVRAEVERLNKKLEEMDKRQSTIEKVIEVNADAAINVAEIDEKINGSEAHNKNCRLVANYNDLESKIGVEETVHTNLDLNIKAERKTKLEIIESRCSELNLGFKLYIKEDGSVYVDRVPIEQLNTARQIEVGIQIYMNTNPKLKILRLNNLSLCDSKTREDIAKVINDNGYQAFVEIVAPDAEELQIDIQEKLEL